MWNRRNFLGAGAILGMGMDKVLKQIAEDLDRAAGKAGFPMVIATWNNENAVQSAWRSLSQGKSALDAVEEGAKIAEANPEDTSVGYGGFPDREGNVTLDACIMDSEGNAGSVVFLEEIKHAVSVARMVMEKTPHVILAGKGAQQFALEQGFIRENLLTPFAKEAYHKWLVKSQYQPVINVERHDTIGILAIDKQKRLSGACSTSGLAFKMRGRVGDSPIIGAGLYVDNEIGAATATGLGEAVLKKVGAFSIVEMMRQGMHPQKACKLAIKRLTSIQTKEAFQVAYIAVNKKGEFGAFSLLPGFQASVMSVKGFEIIEAEALLPKPDGF
ncbi:MAG: N(4)-(beta-N-acetylglucosaminyl)-L-asparaginase [Saprospiraceae bacterium]|nr:N(4)-(beta-N-acetylglucosaminyl)-L-asparaginase [Saprospiraceae bacterium]